MPQDGLTIVFHDRDFNRSVDQIADGSTRDDIAVLTSQGIQAVRALARRTRLTIMARFARKGRARAGWISSWFGLGAFGMPAGVKAEVAMAGMKEGSFIDGRQRVSEPFVGLVNEVSYIDKLQQEDNILGALDEREEDMQQELDRRYSRNLRKHSGR